MSWATIANLGAVGVSRDPLPQELDDGVLTDALNVSLAGGSVERMRGRTGVGPTATLDPHYLLPFTASGSRYILQAGLTKVYANDLTATLTDISRSAGGAYTGTAADRWTGGVLHGVAVLNNGVDVPQFWGGTGVLAPLTAWPAGWTSKAVRPFRNFLVALNQTKSGASYPYLVNWSHSADPGTVPTSWDIADATKDAGEFPLSETAGAIVDGLAMGERFFIYKEDAIYQADYIGQPSIFRFNKISDTYGVFARNCIVNTPAGQVALTAGDLVLNAGQGEIKSLVNNRMRRWLFANIDAPNRALCFLATNPKRNEVLVCFPEVGASACTKALVWNWQEDTLALQELSGVRHAAAGIIPAGAASSWDTGSGSWDAQASQWGASDYGPTDPRLIFSGLRLQVADQGGTLNGTAYTSRIERAGLAFGDPQTVKALKGIRPRIEARTGAVVTFRMGSQMDPSQGVVWGAPINFIVGVDTTAFGFATGRFLAWRMETAEPTPVRLRSMSFDVKGLGQY